VLQQRLNRKIVSPQLIKEFPIHLRAYDLLGEGARSGKLLVMSSPVRE